MSPLKAVHMKLEILMGAYRNLRSQVNLENFRLKHDYSAKKSFDNDEDMKGTWNTINKLVNRRSKATDISFLEVERKVIPENEPKVEAINKTILQLLVVT